FPWLVSAVRAQVHQHPSVETTEGTGISINCSHPSIQSFTQINIYRQLRGRGPEFLETVLRGSKTVKSPEGRLSMAADRQSSALWIAHPRLGDAGVYYCALGD
ncbi:TVA4 protein, partial [Alcedo cyanopectus]|nr:TVA4 protein [Ceyx cyanopectus]